MITIEKCPICNSTNHSKERVVKDFMTSKEDFTLFRCEDCHFIFTSPRPSDEEIGRYYESEDYISHSNKSAGLFDLAYKIVRSRAIVSKEKLISKWVSKKGSLLDYGCGTGEFLGYAKSAGWVCTGVEPSAVASSQAKENHGLTVYSPDDFLLNQESLQKHFDAITLWHVLEHLDDPVSKLKTFNSLLADQGVLVVAVPNHESFDAEKYGSYWAAWDAPIHYSHFSKNTMIHAADNAGFSVVDIKNMPFDSYYVSMLSEKYKGGSALNGLFTGLISNLKGIKKNQSSLIYILKKK